MSAQIIDGRAIAAQVYSELTTRVAVLKAKGVIPRVAIIHVGTEEMTKRYVTLKENAAIRLGMECVTYHLVEDVSQFVPGKTGISTRGRAYLPFGFIIGAFLRKEPISTGVSSVVLCL